ncbi:MAG: hypothetical protein AB1414_14540 [bacterium]
MKRYIFIVVILIIILWAIGGLAVWLFLPNWSIRGTFGDMFGFINSLFSGLALAGVIITILLQKTELELQRHELEMTSAPSLII